MQHYVELNRNRHHAYLNNNNHSVLIEEGSAAEYDQEKSFMDNSLLGDKQDNPIMHQDSDPYG